VREKRPEIHEPEIVLPETGHVAFRKACHYQGLRVVIMPVDPESLRAEAELRHRRAQDSGPAVGPVVSPWSGRDIAVKAVGRPSDIESSPWARRDVLAAATSSRFS
jgi:hypothetical protein